jgi:hypothetical protein
MVSLSRYEYKFDVGVNMWNGFSVLIPKVLSAH